MSNHKITYRPEQGGWIVFDANATTLQARMNGLALPALYSGGDDSLGADRCHIWIAQQEGRATMPLTVGDKGTGLRWTIRDAAGYWLGSVKTKAQARQLVREFNAA